jgi:hypothetical protein
MIKRISALVGSLVVLFAAIALLPQGGKAIESMDLKQARDFAAGIKIRDRIRDGFFSVDLKVAICDSGQFCSTKAATSVDTARDQVLADWLKANTPKGSHLVRPPQVEAMSRSVAQIFTPVPALTIEELDHWYESFCSKHVGQHIPLGTFMTERKGACQQRALLLKLLCDAAGLSCSLVPAYDCNGGRHVWCEVMVGNTTKIFDPTWGVYGAEQKDARYLSAEQLFGDKRFRLRELLPRICESTVSRDPKSLAKWYKDLLQLDESIFGSGSLEVSVDHHNLARALGQDRVYAEAIEHAEWARSIQSAKLGEDNENTKQSAALLQLLRSNSSDAMVWSSAHGLF